MASKKRKLTSSDGSDESPIPKKASRKTPKASPKPKKSPKKHKSLKKLSDSAKKDFDIDSESEDCLVIDECEEGSSETASTTKENLDTESSEQCDNVDDFPLWDISDVLAENTGIRLQVAKNIVKLINEENTLPFIARYRKSMIDHMSPENLQDIFNAYDNITKIRKRSCFILNTLKKKDKLCDDIQKSIINARSLDELDFLYDPFKQRVKTLGERAHSLGLGNAIQSIIKGENVCITSLCNSLDKTPSEIETHIMHGLADIIHKDACVLGHIRKLRSTSYFVIECQKARTRKDNGKSDNAKKPTKSKNNAKFEDKENRSEKYELYVGFRARTDTIKPHQILAINRGEAEKALSVKIVISEHFFKSYLFFCVNKWKNKLIHDAATDAYKRFFHPWLIRKVRSELTDRAVKESVSVFCTNLKRLLLTSPIKGYNIVGIDPGFKAGCKVAIISVAGVPLETFVIYPNLSQPKDKHNDPDVNKLSHFIEKYSCGVIALGDGTACRETEKWLKNIDSIKHIPLVIVPEQGASIYSCSPEAAKEFPKMDPNLISAISLARRALDPLSELIKVNPKNLGVGMYQHDLPAKLLSESLDNVTVNCVSFVGVDLNTCSETLLSKIAGLTSNKVKHILQYRNDRKFKSRAELIQVSGIGVKTYTQCIGFLRVPSSENKLDNTWIHPESYPLAEKLLKELDLQISDLGTNEFVQNVKSKMANLSVPTLASKMHCAISDVDLILEAFTQLPTDDPLRDIKPVYSVSITNSNQLAEGSTLTGVVRNVTTFGIFVDCGVGQNGMIHNTKVGNSRYPQLGDKVLVRIIPPLTETKMPLQLLKILE